MSATTLINPELDQAPVQPKDADQPPFHNGNGGSQSTLSPNAESELQNLSEQELKAAIQSAWKKHERLARKDMGPLLYWLRLKLRAAGSRNDIHDQDRGFGAWVDEHLDISRRTADRWADQYAREKGFREPLDNRPKVVPQPRPGDGPLEGGRLIQVNYWVSPKVHERYEQALKTVKKHLKVANDKEAVVKGVCYAAEILRVEHSGRPSNRKNRVGRQRRAS